METETHTITTHVDIYDAGRLITLAGGTPNARGGWNLHGMHYWQTDEALMMALREIAAADLGR
jgi:hypothetical protein